MIKVPEDYKITEVPIEKRYASVLRGLLKRIKRLYEAVYEKYGDEGLDLIRDVSVSYGQEIAGFARKGGDPWSIDEVGMYLIKIFNNMRAEGEVTELSEQRIIITVPECPYPFKDEAICKAHSSMEEALVKGLNPALDYHIGTSIPAGDSCCQHILSLNV